MKDSLFPVMWRRYIDSLRFWLSQYFFCRLEDWGILLCLSREHLTCFVYDLQLAAVFLYELQGMLSNVVLSEGCFDFSVYFPGLG